MELHYTISGKGARPLLAFHGIGQTGRECFGALENTAGEVYTIYAFDLPFHGESAPFFTAARWDDGRNPISDEEWREFLLRFLQRHDIGNFSVAGFSLGGRFALTTTDLFFDRIDHAWLIAPDGISEQPIFRLATGTALFRKIFRFVMAHSHYLERAATALQKAGLLHTSVLRVVRHMTATPRRSMLVYYSWVNFRMLKGKSSLYAQPSRRLAEKVYVFLGEYDRLIREVNVRVLTRLLPPGNLIRLKAGHRSLVASAVAEILKITRASRPAGL